MIARICLLLFISFALAATAPADPPAVFDLAQHVQLPPGFIIQKIAGPPLLQHPLHVSFDDQGHCYVTEMKGINLNGKELEKDPPNSIRRLTDTDGDGVFDQATVFADKLTFPGGVLWHEGAVYTTSFPYLWKLIDINKDGVADKRIPLLGKFNSIGNAADMHGPQLGPDGWLYFCDGRNGHEITLANGTILKGKASGMYRCKPDGGGLERVFAGGMDNPVEVAFTPAGEPLVCTNIVLANPRHDALLYGLEGGVYPYDLKAIKELTWTGQYLPIMGELGWVAVSSVVRHHHDNWGSEYQDKYFTAEFNTHAIRQHTITRQDASFTLKSAPFLTCTHPDFHPTQVIQAQDGSLILVDTGGWFRNGCPTSQLAKPDVKGGIYRISRKTDAKLKSYATRTETLLPVTKLAQKLSSNDSQSRLAALWMLAQHLLKDESPEGRAAIRSTLEDPDVEIKLTALRLIGQYRDTEAFESVMQLLEDSHAAIRREAATTLGRLKNTDAVMKLVNALAHAEDPYLEHALIFALIRLGDISNTISGLTHESPRVQRGVVQALDQMGQDALTWNLVAPLLQTSDSRLKQSCLDIISKRPLWISDLTDYLDRELSKKQWDEKRLEGLKNVIVALAPQPRLQQLIADRLSCPEGLGPIQFILLEAMAEADISRWPSIWEAPLAQYLTNTQLDDALLLQAILVAQVSQKRNCDGQLRTIAEKTDRPLALRLAAAAVALQDGKPVSDALLAQLLQAVRPNQEPTTRLAAARALGVAHLQPKQLNTLALSLRQAGPLELPLLIVPWERDGNGSDSRLLIQSLEASPGLASLPLDRLQKLISKLPSEIKSSGESLLKKGRPDLAAQQARLIELKPLLNGGDIKMGRELFFGPKAVCSTCHRIGNDGGLVGPNLSAIGAIRTKADLLESILYPNASLARGYETMVVVAKTGKTHTGVLTRETADALVLTNTQRIEQKVLRSDIEEMTASAVSTMPAGIDQTLNPEDLRHLLAYLASLKK